MSTNYFRPITYLTRPSTNPMVQQPTQTVARPLPAQNAFNVAFNGAAAPNQGQINYLMSTLYGTGTPGSAGYVPGINERAGREFGTARTILQNRLRGYGGFSFRQDDPSTPNVDEGLMMDYRPDQLGRNERQAVLAARAQANARGMLSSGFADQQIGAALQRVGAEAAEIVNQYSSQINEIANRYFDPLSGMQQQTITQINSLYGADTTWLTDRQNEAAAAAAAAQQAAAATSAPNHAVRAPGTALWTGRNNPDSNRAWFDQQFGAGNWIVDVEFVRPNPRRPGFNRYTVRAR